MTVSDDHPGPSCPAEASMIMMALLPSWYWESPPPPSGVALMVCAKDRRQTTWCMSEGLAHGVVERLKRDRRIVYMHGTCYEPTDMEAA